MAVLIADSGSTKCEWCLIKDGKKKTIFTQGMSPYFLTGVQMVQVLETELLPKIKNFEVEQVFYYGTGCKNPANRQLIRKSIKSIFKTALPQSGRDGDPDRLDVLPASRGRRNAQRVGLHRESTDFHAPPCGRSRVRCSRCVLDQPPSSEPATTRIYRQFEMAGGGVRFAR